METQFQYISELAKEYNTYVNQPGKLFDAINNLPELDAQSIFMEFADPDRDFRPVNLLRAETIRRFMQGEAVTEPMIEEIKDKIREKDMQYFRHLSTEQLKHLQEYEMFKRDLFANWQKHWNVFHPFFFRGTLKETVQSYLEQICQDLLVKLDLEEYTYHWVDFQGASNFGSDWCWLALFPAHKPSHRQAYQFFLSLSTNPVAGVKAGSNIKAAVNDSLQTVNSYQQTLMRLEEQKPKIVELNSKTRNYFKFSPGTQAGYWNEFYTNGIAAVSFDDQGLGDLSHYNSRNQIKEVFGISPNDKSTPAWNAWLFKTANTGDILFANKGVNTCIGIGILTGEYYYEKSENGYNHKRKVNWITDKIYEYKTNTLKGYKTLFRPDTFSPTRVFEFILDEYLRVYPELAEVFATHNLFFDKPSPGQSILEKSSHDTIVAYEDEDEEEVEPTNFWWLNASPGILSISNHNKGERQHYKTLNERGNKRRIYKYFEAVRPGDLIVGYESSPTKQVKAIYEVTKGTHLGEDGEVIEFQLTEKLQIPVGWNDLKNSPGLENCEVFKNNEGSLFKLSEEEFDIIREIIDNRNIATERLLETSNIIKYSFAKDPDKPFITEKEFLQTIDLLKRKKNVILQGPPGVGKTFIARKLAYEIMNEIQDASIEMVQFHQSYSYEDFIQGLRPTVKGGFEIRDGIFYSFCQRALAHPGRSFFFIIDEINRGNLSKIFGELMMLIEADKRNNKNALKLTYADDENDRFYVPENLYIIGTMNTADRSLAIVDYALRRRFAFVNLEPHYSDSFKSYLSGLGMSKAMIEHICSAVTDVNTEIKKDNNLGAGFQIGHSYFCSFRQGQDEESWWNDILQFEIQPLLEEIWFDDHSKVSVALKSLSR